MRDFRDLLMDGLLVHRPPPCQSETHSLTISTTIEMILVDRPRTMGF